MLNSLLLKIKIMKNLYKWFITVSFATLFNNVYSQNNEATNNDNYEKTYSSLSDAVDDQKKGINVYNLYLSGRNEIDSSILQLKHLKILSFYSFQKKSLPSVIFKLTTLEQLIIYRSDSLEKIPDDIFKLKNLQKISLTNLQNLSSIPLNFLEKIHLSELRLQDLPRLKKICFAKNDHFLKTLSIENCDSLNLPQYFSLDSLTSFELINKKHTNDSAFLKAIANSKILQEVSLKNSNIGYLPKEFEMLSNIERLTFANSEIESFPISFSNFKQLKGLDLSNLSIKTFPESIQNISPLEYVNIYDCEVLDYKKTFEILSKTPVKSLTVSNHNMVTIPSTIGLCTTLTSLSIGSRVLQTLPESIINLKNLKSLNIPSSVTSLPAQFGQLKNIMYCSFEYCHLTQLPEGIWNLPISYFDLSSNQLTSIPAFTNRNDSINILVLQGNKIKELPKSIDNLRNIKELHIDQNNIKTLPKTLVNLQSLEVLGLCNLPHLDIKQAFDVIKELKNLKRIDISENYLAKLPATAFQCTQIENINLYDEGCSSSVRYNSMNQLKNVSLTKKTGPTKQALSEEIKIEKITNSVDTSQMAVTYLFSGDNIKQIRKEGTKFYCSTENSGIIEYDYQSNTRKYYNTATQLLPTNGIKNFTVKNNTIWAISHLKYNEITFFTVSNNKQKSFTYTDKTQKYISNNFSQMLVDKTNRIWVASDNTLIQYNDTNVTYISTVDTGFHLNSIRTIYVDNSNNLWLSSGMTIQKRINNHWVSYNLANLTENIYEQISCITESPSHQIFALSTKANIYTLKNNKWETFKVDKSNYYFYNAGFIRFKNDSTIILAGGYSIIEIKGGKQRIIHNIENQNRDLIDLSISGDTIWVANSATILQYNNENDQPIIHKASNSTLKKNNIYDILSVNDKAYLASESFVYTYKNGSIEALPELPFYTAKKIIIDKENRLIVGGNGIAKFENGTWKELLPKQLFQYDYVLSMVYATDNSLWICNSNLICHLFKDGTCKFYSAFDFGLQERTYYIQSICEYNNKIWVTINTSLYTIENGIVKKIDNLRTNGIFAWQKDKNNTQWFGMGNMKLGAFSKNNEITQYELPNYSFNKIASIHFDKNNTLWCSDNQSLYTLKNNSFTSYSAIKNFLNSAIINSFDLLNNEILIGTDYGLFIFKKDE